MTNPSELMTALLSAQQELTHLSPDAVGQRAEYVSAEHAICETRKTLHNHGLLMLPTKTRAGMIVDDKGIPAESISRVFLLTHVPSGESIELTHSWPIPEKWTEKTDRESGKVTRYRSVDHDTAGADSFGLTYFLRGLMMVPRGNEFKPKVEAKPLAKQIDDVFDEQIKKLETPEETKDIDRIAKADSETNLSLGFSSDLSAQLSKGAPPDTQVGSNGTTLHTPPDYSAQQIHDLGWPTTVAPTVVDLELMAWDAPVDKGFLKDLTKAVKKIRPHLKAKDLWAEVGANKTNGKITLVTGYQARLFTAMALSRGE